ncbi:PR-1-like protein [Calocera viscosa TUFC12733]|uniref:PR-1-like protein n=1 Tax=Calocera viscosa (strain TUFC12733) TaxID=1330018 RepID=A0A167KF23_CALVF|nr:PR-1-like protein [Calocera viscosa TUFC12733]
MAVPDDVPIIYDDGYTEIVALDFAGGAETSSADVAAYLKAHNDFRAKHGAHALAWDNTLSQKAQQWANRCVFKHSGGSLGAYGENLAAGTGSKYDVFAAVKSWTDESKDYNPHNPQPSHFTQVVWKSSTHVGCAVADCNGIFDPKFGKAHFHVCEYSPPGNVIGHFPQNVQV